jgi:hypothetical protein
MTNEVFPHTTLTPNWALRSAALEWREAASKTPAPVGRRSPVVTNTSVSGANDNASRTAEGGSTSTSSALNPASGVGFSSVRPQGSSVAPLPLPDWAQPGYTAPTQEQRPAIETETPISAAQGQQTGGYVSPVIAGDGLSGVGASVDGPSEQVSRHEVDSSSEMEIDAEGQEEPVVIEVGRTGEDVEMANGQGTGEFDDVQLVHWPRVPSHRITSRQEQERVPAFA